MKKVTLFIISILFILSVSACKAEEERQYTYIASDPDFGTQETVEKDFGDFTITFPTSWPDQTEYLAPMFMQEVGDMEFEVFYATWYPSPQGLNSFCMLLFYEVDFVIGIDFFDEAFAQSVAEGMADGSDAEVTVDQLLYGLLGDKESAIVYCSYELYDTISVESIIQLIPADDGYYYLAYCIFNDEGRDDIEAIMNSVKFK